MLGFGLVIPIFPFFVEELGAGGRELGLLVATSALLEFVFAPVWGGLSDRIGRKPVLMIGIVGYGLSSLLFGLSTQLWMLFASRALSGVLSSATLVTSMAYVGDTTTADERGKGMGILGAAMALGVMLGPGLGGWLAGDSLSRPFFIAAALSLLALLLILLLLPESLAVQDRGKGGGKIGSVNLRELWRALSSPIGVLLLMVALFSFALTNFEAVFGLYALEKFSYGPEQVGSYSDGHRRRVYGGQGDVDRTGDQALGGTGGDQGFIAGWIGRVPGLAVGQQLYHHSVGHGLLYPFQDAAAAGSAGPDLQTDDEGTGGGDGFEQFLYQPGTYRRAGVGGIRF